MPAAISSFYQLKKGKIHYLKIGNGPRVVVAFHGYGNDAALFLPLNTYLNDRYTLIAVDLPHHGNSVWEMNSVFEKVDLLQLLHFFMQEFQVDKLSLLGYSMGGRVCLSAIEHLPDHIDKCLLIAADGLVFNPFYFFATHTYLGKILLKRFVQYPDNYIRFMRWLRQKKWINAARFKFMLNYINSKEERAFLFQVWPAMRAFIPNKKIIHKATCTRPISITVFSGIYDSVIPPKHAQNFKRKVPHAKIINLDKGHRIFDAETWTIIAEEL